MRAGRSRRKRRSKYLETRGTGSLHSKEGADRAYQKGCLWSRKEQKLTRHLEMIGRENFHSEGMSIERQEEIHGLPGEKGTTELSKNSGRRGKTQR